MNAKTRPELYIVEDDADMANLMAELAKSNGFNVSVFLTAQAAQNAIHLNPPAVVLTDLRLPDGDGLTILDTARRASLDTQIVLITGYATLQDAVKAFKLGLYDLITKPFDITQVQALLTRLLAQYQHRNSVLKLQTRLAQLDNTSLEPVCQSPQIKQVYNLVQQVSQMDVPVLIEGETGTGKGVLAKFIHQHSPRNNGAYFELNCAAVPANLIESELFGHEKGAFTGAVARKLGLLELADGGTLLLDEINSMSSDVQAKMLHFLQDQTLVRVGGQSKVQVNVRLIFASNQNLHNLVEEGTFRQDLYYRINVFPVQLPPLRERPEDIQALAERFLSQFSQKFNKPIERFSDEALEQLQAYHWPGNIRELENIVQRAVVLAQDKKVESHHLPLELRPLPSHIALTPALSLPDNTSLEELESAWIQYTLERCQGNKSLAARELGIDNSTLHRKLSKLKITTIN
ncbi:sigma-54-dependent transcriptional regulator [Thiomicrospira cyclica]|uniref:Two component, sigma54 specific, transcriptional regulator, Fis family n=1 Tax=Thiomicrospira cyclica (strain DSM 14477 / JCM 11371 / ALM1) TaxID=717773 RepID=F6DAV3_THICA|nr:sigma-54 dependent transcriptional regulator [Thiomicrospira cyclica]AEG31196.1 two component, sigma54 specific, transcriptional regulator, Fis family [Thiomicrospira cyclica ALM1]